MVDHYKGNSPSERYDNDLLNEIRKANIMLEQIAQLLQQEHEQGNEDEQESKGKRTYKRRSRP